MSDSRRERYFMNALSDTLRIRWSGDPKKDEAPDFFGRLGSMAIGIELTEFYLPPRKGERPHQEQAALRARIVNAAEALYSGAGRPAMYVTVFFRNGIEYRKHDVRRVAKSIAAAVSATRLPRHYSERVQADWRDLPRDVVQIGIRRSIDGVDALWYSPESDWVAEVDPAEIQSVLDRKEGSVHRGKRRCDELWLVVVEDEFGLGTPVRISSRAQQSAYHTAADRVLWLRPHGPSAIELARHRERESAFCAQTLR